MPKITKWTDKLGDRLRRKNRHPDAAPDPDEDAAFLAKQRQKHGFKNYSPFSQATVTLDEAAATMTIALDGDTTKNFATEIFTNQSITADFHNPTYQKVWAIMNREATEFEQYIHNVLFFTDPYASENPRADGVAYILYDPKGEVEFDDQHPQPFPLYSPEDCQKIIQALKSGGTGMLTRSRRMLLETLPRKQQKRYLYIDNYLNRPYLSWFKLLPDYREKWHRLFDHISATLFAKLVQVESQNPNHRANWLERYNENVISWIDRGESQKTNNAVQGMLKIPLMSADIMIFPKWASAVFMQICHRLFRQKPKKLDLLSQTYFIAQFNGRVADRPQTAPDVDIAGMYYWKIRDDYCFVNNNNRMVFDYHNFLRPDEDYDPDLYVFTTNIVWTRYMFSLCSTLATYYLFVEQQELYDQILAQIWRVNVDTYRAVPMTDEIWDVLWKGFVADNDV